MGTFTNTLKGFLGNNARLKKNGNYDLLDVIAEDNPQYQFFNNLKKNREAILRQNSVSAVNTSDSVLESFLKRSSPYHVFMYSALPDEKAQRIQDWRRIASNPTVSNALDEFCDEFIVEESDKLFYKFNINNEDLGESDKEELRKEFKKIIGFFNLKRDGWGYVRKFLSEAELYFENLISTENLSAGIVGVLPIPTSLIDPVYGNTMSDEIKSYIIRKPIMDETDPTKIKEYKLIPLAENQVTYIHSNMWNDKKTFRLPFIEFAREATRRLYLIEDSLIIFRLVRAPEKLVFNIDVGTMSTPEAESMIRRMQEDYWSRKTFDTTQGGATQKFNPQSTLDSFWFLKRTGQEGSNVTSLKSGENLGNLPDLDYFKKNLYESLKVPTSRLKKDSTANVSDASVQREELTFARAIMRVQQQFSEAIKTTYINHLKLKGIYQKLELRESDVDLIFNIPSTFYVMRRQQLNNIRMANYKDAVADGTLSSTLAQKEHLDYTDTQIKANRAFLEAEALFKWKLGKIAQHGPNWRKKAQMEDNVEVGALPDMGGGAGGGSLPPTGGGGSIESPPGFGGGEQGGSPGGEGASPDAGAQPEAGAAGAPPTQPGN